MQQEIKKRSTLQRIGRIVLKTVLGIFFLIIAIFLLILTPPVQNFIRKKAVSFLEKKLDTKVNVGRIYVGLPKNIILENVYIEDRKQDTLLSGGKIKVNINFWRLLTKSEVNFESIQLDDITAKISRQLPDTSFNFQFIVDAFAPTDTNTTSSSGSSGSVNIGSVELNRIRLVFKDVITGNDAEAWLDHFDTRIKTFDLDQFRFDVPATNISGLTARVYQSKPLVTPDPPANDMLEAREPPAMQLNFKEVDLQAIKLDYRNDVSAMYTTFDIGKLNVKPNSLDLTRRYIDIGSISLDNTSAAIRLGKKSRLKWSSKKRNRRPKARQKWVGGLT